MYALLQLLPNLKQLYWSSSHEDNNIDLPLPDGTAVPLIFLKLKKLEYIRAEIEYIEFPWILDLLGLTFFCNLTKLDVYMVDVDRNGSHFTRVLIDSIKNTPALEYLILEAVINLEDMEVLHVNVPKLKAIYLDARKLEVINNTTMKVSDNGKQLIGVYGSYIVQFIATNLASFSLSISPIDEENVFEMEEFQQTIQKWIIYISQYSKYTYHSSR